VCRVSEPQTAAVMVRELGRQLAALRRAAGLTQHQLAALTSFSRTALSLAEIGRESHARQFWEACECATRRCCYPNGGERPSISLPS
jgi:DNA-binding XRE family transcriptional regulator